MFQKSKIGCILTVIVIYLAMFMSSVIAQNMQQIEIIIDSVPGGDKETHYYKGEELRGQFLFEAAIYEYQQVLSGGEPCGLESKAHYNIGLCYTWLQLLDEARKTFSEVIQLYPKDDIAVAFAEYGIAWIDTREGNYNEAINRLQKKLAEKNCDDMEHNARMQFHIGRIYLKYQQDYASAKDAFLLVLHDYPAAAIANHPFLDRLRGSPGLVKPALNGFLLSPPITIDIVAIKFDYDHNSNSDDAVDIKNASSDIPVPEWEDGGATNAKMAYIKSSSSRKIKAQFWCDLDNNYWKIGADVLNGTGFGDLPSIWVEFPTGHISSYVTYTANGTVPGTVGIRNFRWNWYVWWGLESRSLQKSSAAQKLSVETTGPHYYYTLLGSPHNPMSQPWTDVLDYACDWASGKSSKSSALEDLTEELYECGVKYHGGEHYTKNPSYTNLDLSDLLIDLSNPNDVRMDCRDFSNFLQVLLNSLGGNCQYNRIGNGFYYNYLWPSGRSPVFDGWWNYHQVGWYSSAVADASTQIDNDTNPRSSPHSWKLAKGDMTLSDFIEKLTYYTISSVETGTCTVY